MKKKTLLYLHILAIIVVGCSSNNQSSEGLPIIDLRKNYPEKEIVLTDIADVTYVHLSAQKDEYLYKGTIQYVSTNSIIVVDESSGSILFFSKDGTPKSRFNHFGNGPQDYGPGSAEAKSIHQIIYDEQTDEVFINPCLQNIFQVYSSTGKYLRTIESQIGLGNSQIDFFDNESFIIHSGGSFVLMSKDNGEVLEYVEIPKKDVDLTVTVVYYGGRVTVVYGTDGLGMVKCIDGFNIFNPGTDTAYYFDKNKTVTPVLRTTPSANELNPVIILDNFWDVGKYQFMRLHTRHNSYYLEDNPMYPDRYYVRDKETGEVFRQKIIMPDYKGKTIFFSALPLKVFQEKMTHFELNLFELKQAYNENRLSGKLKELVSTLSENEDNNVFMFVHFN